MTTRRLLVLFESVRATRATTPPPAFPFSSRARCPITRDDNGRSIDRWMMRRFDTKRRRRRQKDDENHSDDQTKERRKDTGRTSVSSWTACPGAYPAYPAMSESTEKVVRTSSRVQTQPSERPGRATEEEEYHRFFTTTKKLFLLCS